MRDALRESQAFFGDKVREYRESASHGDRDELASMLARLGDVRGRLALDVATGGGQTAGALEAAGARVVASDATPAMLAGARRPGVVADAQALPFREASFDVVASRIAPHHFPDLADFCQEAARVLRQGGRFYVFDLSTPDGDEEAARLVDEVERMRDPSHLHSRSPAEWRAALAAAPFRIDSLEERTSTFALEPWVARARMPPGREARLRELLGNLPRDRLKGYGPDGSGNMRVLRVELAATRT